MSEAPRGAHGLAVSQLVGELVPIAELLLPIVRKQLAVELRGHLPDLDARVATDVVGALSVHGVRVSAEQAARLRSAGDDSAAWARAELRTLIGALDSNRPLSVAGFVDQLLVYLVPAMQAGSASRRPTLPADPAVARELTIPPEQLAMMIRGDVAFRLLVAFLEHTRKVLQAFFPRSMLDVRAKRTE